MTNLRGKVDMKLSCLSIGLYAPKTAQNSTCAIVVCIVINPMWRSVIPIKNNSVIPINLKNYSVPLKRHTCWLGWLDVRSSDIFKIYSFPQVTSLTFVYLNKCSDPHPPPLLPIIYPRIDGREVYRNESSVNVWLCKYCVNRSVTEQLCSFKKYKLKSPPK